ncbi:flavin monoamine oxidase family protein [Methylobacter psychrophilus]|uniref:flavin monoamine oxidase family protein n=1 Tax=Methylobacter psychrophilus TaxID=96941 RepID=UPI0021D4D0F1|nr:FAD-dependent oxidoreductase [Methylobacter psychrophilus]
MASSYKLNQVEAEMTICFLNIRQRFIGFSFLTLMLGLQSGLVYADNNSADVLIVGAGLSGLSSAYYLKKAGKTVVILEMSPHVGGRIRTASYPDNAQAEIGLEEFWESNPALEILHELNVPLETSYTSFSSFYYQSKLYPFTHKSNLEFLQSVISDDEMDAYKKWDKKMTELYKQLEIRPLAGNLLALKEISFADWIHETSGLSVKTQEFVRIETEPEYATSWQQISALDGIAEWHFFSGKGQSPYHVVGGNQRAAQAIADFVGNDNIGLNQLVTHIKSTDTGVEITTTDMGTFQQQVYRAKYAITTVPLFRLNDIQFNPPLSSDRKEAIRTQLGGAYFTAHVLVDNKARHYWTAKGESLLPILSDGPLGVIYEGKSEANKDAVLNLLVTGIHAERFNARANGLEDDQKALLEAFEKQWPGFGSSVKQMTFYRYHPRAIASWPVGRSRFDSLSDSLRLPQGRIYFAGDFTEDTHSNGASTSAIRVVDDVLKQKQ